MLLQNYPMNLIFSNEGLVAAAAAGIASHLGFFIRGDYHISAPIIARVYFVLLIVVSFLGIKYFGIYDGSKIAATVSGVYVASLLSSIVVYRKFFHRIRDFPGPCLAAFSKLWHIFHLRDSHNHLFLDKLHEKYGTFVRTGPTEVTIFSPEVVKVADGPNNNCTKAVWYDIVVPLTPLNTTRDKAHHDQRCRIWNQSFTKKGSFYLLQMQVLS